MFVPLTRGRMAAFAWVGLIAFFVLGGLPGSAAAQESTESEEASQDSEAQSDDGDSSDVAAGEEDEADSSSNGSASSSSPSSSRSSRYRPYSEVLEDAERVEGLITLHKKEERLYAELRSNQFDRDFIILITIARGIGQSPLVSGYSWSFGDDWVLQFRRAGERIHLVRRNVRFTAERNSPSARAVELAYTDSVLFSLPIATRGPSGSYVIDVTPVFMSDLPQISQVLSGFSFSGSKSTWADINGFDRNVEIQVAATYASSGRSEFDSVPDSRGVTVNVHYSISRLPETNYVPRLADDRVGYFVTALKDFSKPESEDRFQRYITRWNLQKSDPRAEKSPPKEPIVFWLEKTIPYKYRKPIRDGIAEWNNAFEKAGFYDAIDVRQQPDDAEWEPGDINYNTFRWITSGAGFAMGPSRVNPTNGEILDADIIFDADFLQYWKQYYETFTPEGIAAITGGPLDLETYRAQQRMLPDHLHNTHSTRCSCNLLNGMSRQLAWSATVLAARRRSPEDMEKLIMQGLKEVAMHEVGHTLGLRHNFRASAFYTLDEINDVEKTRETGLGASVMDYNPINIVPEGDRQGDYYSTTIGPYDYWAIEYGYTPFSSRSTEGERDDLLKIAARSGEPGLAFGTDEDARGIDPDPHITRYDFGKDLIEYAKLQAKVVDETMPNIVEQMADEGDSYERVRQAFGVLLSIQGQAMNSAARYIGGLHVSRSHKGDEGAPAPVEVVDAEKQREALKLLEESMFSAEPFKFPPELYSYLTPTRWSHWGLNGTERVDYPAHEVILLWQERMLSRLLSSLTLTRLHDAELKIPADEDAFTTAELIEGLTQAIYSELQTIDGGDYTNRQPAVSSLRRNLQRSYLRRLSDLALGNTTSPQDCQTLAFAQLTRIQSNADRLLDGDVVLDSYTQAHLEETSARITKVLDAIMVTGP